MNDLVAQPVTEDVSADCDVLIPWSGGFDSTALILKAVKEGKRVGWSAYVTTNNQNQSDAESQARLKIAGYLHTRNIKIHGYVTDRVDVDSSPKHVMYAVPRLIVTSTVMGPPAPEIWLGYCRTDCHCRDWSFEDHASMVPIIQSLWKISRSSPVPTVRFPFLDVDKVDILNYYRDYRPVFDMLATCQNGYNDVSLCNCEKCHKLEGLRAIFERSMR